MKLRFLAVLALPLAVACSKGETHANHAEEAKAAQGQPQAAAAKDPAAAEKPAAAKPGPDGKVQITATQDAFEPSRVEAEAGKPLTLVFNRTVEKTCMNKVVFPDLGIEKELPVGQPVEVTVTPEAGGTIRFQCPMGMGKSAIVSMPQS